MMYADWRSIPIPKRMKALGRDKRGFPIPFTVLRDTDGCPHFAANDGIRQHKARYESRCQICGGKLDSLKWLVGGPLCAFMENGAYMDTAMHYECVTYALRVCPYLAAPNYLRRIDDAGIDYDKLPEHIVGLVDHTMIPERPELIS